MRQLAALALALLALAPACQDEPGEPMVDDRPRGERCDELQACGRAECAVEMAAVRDCNLDDLGCGADEVQSTAVQEALADCIEASGCNTTSCDVVGAFTDRSNEADAYCTDPADAEVLELARIAMFVDLTDPAVAECQALE